MFVTLTYVVNTLLLASARCICKPFVPVKSGTPLACVNTEPWTSLGLFLITMLNELTFNSCAANISAVIAASCYIRQGGYVFVVCFFGTDLHEILMEGWQWADEQMVIRIRIRIWIQIHIATLVRCALAEVCTVLVLLVTNSVVQVMQKRLD